jgi:hypothetical protein
MSYYLNSRSILIHTVWKRLISNIQFNVLLIYYVFLLVKRKRRRFTAWKLEFLLLKQYDINSYFFTSSK